MPLLVDKLINADFDVKKEACWAISNATTGGSTQQIRSFVTRELLDGMIQMAGGNDSKIAHVALESLENILKAGEVSTFGKATTNAYVEWFEEMDGIDLLESLQEHQNQAIYERAVAMIETFFEGEEEVDENAAPNRADNGSTFSFGFAAKQPTNVVASPIATGAFAF